MKILWFIENLSLGGQQTQSINLIKEISKIENITVDVLYFNDGPLKDKFKEVCSNLIHLSDFNKKAYQNPVKLLRLIKLYYTILNKNKYDVVMSNGIISYGFSSILKLFLNFIHVRLLGGPLLDIEPTYEKYFHTILPFHRKVDIAFGWLGENTLEKKRYKNKLVALNSAVDSNMFYQKNRDLRFEVRNKYQIKENEVVIGWVGRISVNMQVKNTIALGGELKRRGVLNFKILIVGGGDWELEMADLIRNENIVENCICLGWQPMEYIPNLFQAMDIVPLLEKNPAGGSIVREAMACGKLVISVDGKNRVQSSWIFNGDNGILVSDDNFVFESANVVEEYLKDNTGKYKLICDRGVSYAKNRMSFKEQSNVILKNILDD
jgi:glycosyltransferase involved in cell wall biosynthesis